MGIRETILEASDIGAVPMMIPEWGVVVFIASLTAHQRDWLEQHLALVGRSDVPLIVRAKVAVMVLRDETGKPIFADQDVPLLGGKSGDVLDRIYSAVLVNINADPPASPPIITGGGFPKEDELAKQIQEVSAFADAMRAKEPAGK